MPPSATAEDGLARELERVAGLEADGGGVQAALAYRRLADRWPRHPELCLAEARAQLAIGDADAAEAALDRAAGALAGDPRGHAMRARVATALREPEAAVSARERAGDAGELARALARAGRFAEAEPLALADADAGAAAEVEAWRDGEEAFTRWWASGAPPVEVVVAVLRRAIDAGAGILALERFGALRPVPAGPQFDRMLAESVAIALAAGLDARAALARAGAVTPAGWGRVVDQLIRQGSFDAARELVAVLPGGPAVERLRERLRPILDRLPHLTDLPPELRGGAARTGVTVIRSPGATRAVMILGGMASPVLHPHLIARGADVIHLRDFRRVNFLGGIEGLGHDWASTVVALRALALAEGDRDLYTVGMSGPGYAAIRLGLDLHARAVLALAAPTDLSTAPEAEDGRGRAMIDRTRHRAPHMAADARPLIAAAADPPRFHLWHGAGMPQDRRHAEHLNGLPSVTVRAVEGANRHNVLLDMIERGLLEGALDAFLA